MFLVQTSLALSLSVDIDFVISEFVADGISYLGSEAGAEGSSSPNVPRSEVRRRLGLVSLSNEVVVSKDSGFSFLDPKLLSCRPSNMVS